MTFTCVFGLVMAAALPPVEAPPAPQFDATVDYLKWMRTQLAFAEKDNAVEFYADFLYATGGEPAEDNLELAGYAVSHQLEALSKQMVPWAPTQYVELAEWLDKTGQRYAPIFRAAQEKPNYALRIDPKWKRLRDASPGYLKNATVVGRARLIDVWRITGKVTYAQKFEDALRANFSLTDHLCQGLTPDEQMIAAGQRAFLYEQVRHGCPNPVIQKANWKRIAEFFEKADAAPLTACYARGLYWEEARAYEDLSRLFTQKGDGEEFAFEEPAWQKLAAEDARLARLPADVVGELRKSNPRELARLIHDHFGEYRAILESGDGRNLRQKLTNIDENTIRSSPALRAFASSQKLGVIGAFRTEAMRRAMHIYLRALVSFHDSGRWPQSLDALAGEDLADCRIDPFSGQDLRTRLVKGAMLVYSVGPDGKDDQASEFSDVVFVTRPAH